MDLKEKIKIMALLDREIDLVEAIQKSNKTIEGIYFLTVISGESKSIQVFGGIEKIAEAVGEQLKASYGSSYYPYKYSIIYSGYEFYKLSKTELEVK